MLFTVWFIVVGALLIVMALFSSILKRLPLTSAMFYLAVGLVLGPLGVGLIMVEPVAQAAVLERITEVVVLISLFTAGLKLRTPFSRQRWWLPLRLAVVSMLVTIAAVTLVGVALLGLPIGVAVLLGAVLAPTDPVLASDVQVEDPGDQDKLRFSLTGEAGLNDGTAFPFVMLGLGLMGLHELGSFGWRWVAVDVIWATAVGLAVGAGLGALVGRLVVYLRRTYRQALGFDDFLALGLTVLAYGVALLVKGYGFLAVFAAGLALARVGRRETDSQELNEIKQAAEMGRSEEVATDPEKAPTYMAQAALGFNEQIERIAEVGVVLLLGGMLMFTKIPAEAIWFVPLLFLIIRPVAVYVGLFQSRLQNKQRGLVAWFGVRGVGSIYYLMYALHHGVPDELGQRLTGLTFAVVVTSIVVHGVSVTPLMRWYRRSSEHRREAYAAKGSTEMAE